MCSRELGQNVVEISHEFQQYTYSAQNCLQEWKIARGNLNQDFWFPVSDSDLRLKEYSFHYCTWCVESPYAPVTCRVSVLVRVTMYKWDPGALVLEIKQSLNLQNGAVASGTIPGCI